MYLLLNRLKINTFQNIQTTNRIIYHIIATITLISMFPNALSLFICSIIYTIINFINCYSIDKEYSKVDLYCQPLVLLLTISSIFNIIGEVTNVNYIYILPATIVVYGLMQYIIKEPKIKKMYYILLIIFTILTGLINLASINIIVGLTLVLSSIYIYKINNKSIWSYIQILLFIILLKVTVAENILLSYIPDIATILTFITITYICKDNIKLKKINLIAIAIPLFSLITKLNLYSEFKSIVSNIFALYILSLIIMFYVKKTQTKDILSTIFVSLILITIMFNQSILIGIYVGIIGIAIILGTYNKNDFKTFFYCGIVITILNILIQLSSYWSRIPLWLYLLLSGGAIIGFVTYKELKKQQEPEIIEPSKHIEKIEHQENKEQNKKPIYSQRTNKFCPYCGNKNNGNKFCTNCGKSLVINEK